MSWRPPIAPGSSSSSMRLTMGSGPLTRYLPGQQSSWRMRWRPVLAVGIGIAVSIAALCTESIFAWSEEMRSTVAVLVTAALIIPTCVLEHRSRCLVGVIPCLALFDPFTTWWGIPSVWVMAVAIAWWYRHRELRAVPEGLKQRQLAKQLERYPLLHSACLELATARDDDDVARILADQSMRLGIGTIAAGVYLPRDDKGITMRARVGLHPQALGQSADDEVDFVARECRPLIRRAHQQLRMLLPLLAERESSARPAVSAVMEVFTSHDSSVDDYNVELQDALARMGGIALGTVDLLQQTRSLALRDGLTGLLGQQEFRRRGEEQIAAMRRHGGRLSLIVCDLDRLKEFNDRYGHLAGDQALQAVARSLNSVANATTLLGRWGGEEFVLLLTAIDEQTVESMAADLCQRIRETVVDDGHPQRRVSASLGVAHWTSRESFDDLLRRADAACYNAKDAGRDQVVVAATGVQSC